jgi:GT2 family glycosyltransferase
VSIAIMRALTWSLVVATLNREDCLLRSLLANSQQRRPPRQIIIVDASDNWERSRDRVFAEVAARTPQIEWIYVHSDEKSSTRQRNQGLARCDGDVVFFLDDDSFMYRDCSEEIMRVYEADDQSKIGGVSAALADAPEGTAPPCGATNGGLSSFVRQAVQSMWHQEKLFIPYDGTFHLRKVDDVDARLPEPLIPVCLLQGCRMTFRTPLVRVEGGFADFLVRTAYAEDADLSYRISRKRALVLAPRAKLYHEQTPVQRPNRSRNTSLILLNAIALYRLSGAGSRGGSREIYGFLAKRALLELLRDCARPSRGMAHTRGVLRAIRYTPTVLSLERDRLRREYINVQNELFEQG